MDVAGLFAVFVLVGGALLAGLGIGRTVEEIVGVVGRVFSAFGILILSGTVIGKVPGAGGGIAGIAADVRLYVREPTMPLAAVGFPILGAALPIRGFLRSSLRSRSRTDAGTPRPSRTRASRYRAGGRSRRSRGPAG